MTDKARCPACIEHPGWAHGDVRRRREPQDVCRTCLGSGVAPRSFTVDVTVVVETTHRVTLTATDPQAALARAKYLLSEADITEVDQVDPTVTVHQVSDYPMWVKDEIGAVQEVTS